MEIQNFVDTAKAVYDVFKDVSGAICDVDYNKGDNPYEVTPLWRYDCYLENPRFYISVGYSGDNNVQDDYGTCSVYSDGSSSCNTLS